MAYQINPYDDDFFKRLIELRKEVQGRKKGATGAKFERLDTEQNSIKITANSVSYGIYIEVNVDTRNFKTRTTVHSSTCEPFSFSTDKSELPGSYFHPLLGTLITGAARLMLAIAETLTSESQLDWSFCDTDSIAIAKPDALNPTEFNRRVESIVNWFGALNPYSFPGSILKIEDVNSGLETGLPEPLYCWAISSKRYALFNLDDNRQPILRKVSAHGLGQYFRPYGDDEAPATIPAPHSSVLGTGTERWHCDFWYQIVRAALAGTPDQVDRNYHPALNQPAVSRYGATTPELLNWFSKPNQGLPYREQVKPFNFLLAMTAKQETPSEEILFGGQSKRRKPTKPIKPIAPFDKCIAKAIGRAFDRETGKPVPAAELRTLGEALAQYHLHPESKFLDGDFCYRGTTRRRHVRVTGTRHIGKEANDLERQAVLGLNVDSQPDYGFGAVDPVLLANELRPMIVRWGMAACARAFGVSAAALRSAVEGSERISERSLQAIAARLPKAKRLFECVHTERRANTERLRAKIDEVGLRPAARHLGIDPSNLRRKVRLNSIKY
jgi:DNA polymerase elongation subunit (family B)